MGKRKVGALEKIEADLISLQHKIRRDPQSYRDDFLTQLQQYEAMMAIAMDSPIGQTSAGSTTASTSTGLNSATMGAKIGSGGGNVVSLHDLIGMISHVADSYPDLVGARFADQLSDLLLKHHTVLDPDLRDKVAVSLVLLRNRDVITSSRLQEAFFPLLVATPSKAFRSLLLQKILSDLRNANANTTNHRLNKTTQSFFFDLITADRESAKAVWPVRITRELWRRRVWTDAKPVEIMREACMSDCPKVAIAAIRFFLGADQERETAADESDDENQDLDLNQIRHTLNINKKSKKKENELKRAAATVKRKQKKKVQPAMLNFSALHLLHDPQGFADALFSKHLQQSKSKFNLDQRLLALQLVTRLVGLHELQIPALYSYFLRFLTPKQPSATSFLASLAQATHSLVPPDGLTPLITKIANEFVSEASASEVACAGLNAIREICVRQPLAMEDTLLQDLIQYRKSKDKGVMMAAKGLLSLFRTVDPTLLKRRDRGKDASIGLRTGEITGLKFGETGEGGIDGLDLLEEFKDEERRKKKADMGEDGSDVDQQLDDEDEEAGWNRWMDDSGSDSDSSGGWVDVESDGENIQISDSDDSDDEPDNDKDDDGDDGANENDATKPRKKQRADDDKAESQTGLQPGSLATTRILTPADLAKLNELRTQQSIVRELTGSRRRHVLAREQEARRQKQLRAHADDGVTAEEIVAPAALSAKKTKEDKVAAKGDKEKHASSTAVRKEKKAAAGKSTTNREKARNKNMIMTLGKARSKAKRSLIETRNVLKEHQNRQKRGGRRGNNG